MQVRFLNIDKSKAYLLGYELKLSKTELALLYEISQGGKTGVDDLLNILSSGVSRGNVSVHVNAINNKAKKISGRNLVVFNNGRYTINPFM